MATVLRNWAFRYPWFYDLISSVLSLTVGGETRLRQLPVQGLDHDHQSCLDLCTGSGLSAQALVQLGYGVTGLDCSRLAVAAAQARVPEAKFIWGRAERPPFKDACFDLVHISLALHEMPLDQIRKVCTEALRVLKPGGHLVLLDFHRPNFLFWPGLALFLWLFETRTAWNLIRTDLAQVLIESGFRLKTQRLYVGSTLQVIQAQKPLLIADADP